MAEMVEECIGQHFFHNLVMDLSTGYVTVCVRVLLVPSRGRKQRSVIMRAD